MKWIGGFILLALLYAGSVWAQETQVPLTLEESIKIAMERSLVLHSAVEGVVGSQFRQKEAITNFLPTWTGQYSYTRYDSPWIVGFLGTSGTLASGRDIHNLSTTVAQPIFTGGANLANYRLQKLGVDISKMTVETARRDIVLQVRTGYFNILRALKLRDVAEQTVKQFQAQLEVAEAFFEIGIVAKNDVLQAEVSLANAKQTLVKAENDLAVAKSSFNTLLRRDVNTPFSVVDILQYKPFPLPFEESLGEALRRRPEIKSAEDAIKQAQEGVKIARSGFFPAISIAGNYNRLSDAIGLQGNAVSYRLTFQTLATFTLWNWGNTAYQVGENKVKVNQAQDAKGELIDSITLEVRQDYLNMLTAEKNIGTAQKAVEQAEENLRMNEERYKYQVATATDVLIAVTLLDQTRTNYYSSLADFNVAKAQLERAMGRMYP
jgi:outer membrane protein TolC